MGKKESEDRIVVSELFERHKLTIKLRSAYTKIFGPEKELLAPVREMDKERTQEIVREMILRGEPMMMARFGSIECDVCENVRNAFYRRGSNLRFIRHRGQPNFINPYLVPLFSKNAGFFPADSVSAWKRFYELMVDSMGEVDILQSWCHNERMFDHELRHAVKIDREISTPLLAQSPWTLALEGKRVLVVHPFRDTILSQYARIDKVFPKAKVMPQFHLEVVKAVQSAGGNRTEFGDWFEALQYMRDEIDRHDYDICLLGCGAYGFPLAAHCKRRGKQAIHLGGVLQLLFGIKGERWEHAPQYVKDFPYAANYFNEWWVRASKEERPDKAEDVEGACYW